MTQTQAWLEQVKADALAAERVFKRIDASSRCQVIAKYQQIVEKSVKAMVAAALELGVEFTAITASHRPYKEIHAPTNLSRVLDDGSIDFVRRTFDPKRQRDIEELCELAPAFPRGGSAFLRNTEYPFNLSDGSWTAPATADSFTLKEVKRYRELAWVLKSRASKFAQSVRRRPGVSRGQNGKP